MTDLDKMMILTGESDEELLSLLLEDAKDFVLGYTNRTKLLPELERSVRDLAVVAYNRLGTEGENSRTGGGESYSFDAAPRHIYDILDRYRLVRIGGRAYEAKAQSSCDMPPRENDSIER